MEKDDEIKGTGNSYDFGSRMYDARVARWLSIDPMAFKYPNESPYNFGHNSPLFFKILGVRIQLPQLLKGLQHLQLMLR